MAPPELLAATTFAQWIGKRAEIHGDRVAVTFLDHERPDVSWTYAQLWQRSCYVASLLSRVNVDAVNDPQPPRALLLYPPGIEFLAGFLGCQIAGWIPVPTCHPKPGRAMPRIDSTARDCKPFAILGDRDTLERIDPSKLSPGAASVARIATDLDGANPVDQVWVDPDSLSIDADSLAILQYTSGSTSDPKGVMVRHRNLMANLDAIRHGFKLDWQGLGDDNERPKETGVFWLPFFHDMGLIGGILTPLYLGGKTVLMSPDAFLQRPIRWLQAISDHAARFSGAKFCLPALRRSNLTGPNRPPRSERLEDRVFRSRTCAREDADGFRQPFFEQRFLIGRLLSMLRIGRSHVIGGRRRWPVRTPIDHGPATIDSLRKTRNCGDRTRHRISKIGFLWHRLSRNRTANREPGNLPSSRGGFDRRNLVAGSKHHFGVLESRRRECVNVQRLAPFERDQLP